MAQQPPGHSTDSPDDPDAITQYHGNGSSKDFNDARKYNAPAKMPLRQAMQYTPPAPKIHDITEKFTTACSALDVGQLVKDEYFTLFESIGAIEVMDPKMDSGLLQPGETLEESYDALAPLLPEEIIGIMDQLLRHEMAWHTGYPLSQTLFTSVYIDKLLWPEPKTLDQAQFYRGDIPDSRRPGPLLEVLRAYCLALIKCCDFAIAKVAGRDYFEEEDFCTHTFNRVLFVQVPIDVFLRELDAAIEQVEDGDLKIDNDLRAAIIIRLQFRQSFLSALDLDYGVDDPYKYWPPLLHLLPNINASHQLGKEVPESFSTKIQRRLASTVPPRPIVEFDFTEAFSKLKQFCTECEEATRFTTLPSDPLEFQSFIWAYASRAPAPLPYSRSYLATMLFHPDTLNTGASLPLTDLKTVVFPCSPVMDPSNWALSPPRNPALPKPPRLQLSLLIDEFVDRAGQPYLELWTALGQNRCRLRRMLTHVIISWDQLQLDASLVDEDLIRVVSDMGIADQVHAYPLTTWVYHKKLWIAEKVILLGVEQDIYLPDELAGMYYFLFQICWRRKGLLSNLLHHFETRKTQCLRHNNPTAIEEIETDKAHIDLLHSEAKGLTELSSALHKLHTILLYLHLIPPPTRPFSTETLRYELRMKPFLSLQPPEALPFPEFQIQTQPYGPFTAALPSFRVHLSDPQSELWTEIENSIKAAKESFSRIKKSGAKVARAGGVEGAWNREVQGLLASCVALGVAVVGVKNAVKDSSRGGGGEKNVDLGVGGGSGSAIGIRVEVPAVGDGKRYSEGWAVPKVFKV